MHEVYAMFQFSDDEKPVKIGLFLDVDIDNDEEALRKAQEVAPNVNWLTAWKSIGLAFQPGDFKK